MAARTTKLKAINVMLGVIGESSVNTITGTNPFEVSLAIDILDEICRELTQDKFVFNFEDDVSLVPEVAGYIIVPADYSQVRGQDGKEYIIRDDGGIEKLYNIQGRTFIFTATLKADVVFLLDFEDLPEAGKRYCLIRAARVYADRLVGSKDIRAFTERDEIEAKAKLANYQHGVGKVNMLSQSSSVRKILNRSI